MTMYKYHRPIIIIFVVLQRMYCFPCESPLKVEMGWSFQRFHCFLSYLWFFILHSLVFKGCPLEEDTSCGVNWNYDTVDVYQYEVCIFLKLVQMKIHTVDLWSIYTCSKWGMNCYAEQWTLYGLTGIPNCTFGVMFKISLCIHR